MSVQDKKTKKCRYKAAKNSGKIFQFDEFAISSKAVGYVVQGYFDSVKVLLTWFLDYNHKKPYFFFELLQLSGNISFDIETLYEILCAKYIKLQATCIHTCNLQGLLNSFMYEEWQRQSERQVSFFLLK